MTTQRPDHITEADWNTMTPRQRRRAATPEFYAEKPAEQKPYELKAEDKKIIAAGGEFFIATGNYPMIELNHAGHRFVFDCIAQEWRSGGASEDRMISAMMRELGI